MKYLIPRLRWKECSRSCQLEFPSRKSISLDRIFIYFMCHRICNKIKKNSKWMAWLTTIDNLKCKLSVSPKDTSAIHVFLFCFAAIWLTQVRFITLVLSYYTTKHSSSHSFSIDRGSFSKRFNQLLHYCYEMKMIIIFVSRFTGTFK